RLNGWASGIESRVGVSAEVSTINSSRCDLAAGHGAPQGGHSENHRVKFLTIPQLCEVKTDRRRILQSFGFYLLDEPGQAVIHGVFRRRAGIEQNFDGQSRLFDA